MLDVSLDRLQMLGSVLGVDRVSEDGYVHLKLLSRACLCAVVRRGIDSLTYYMVDTHQFVQLLNFSGCGNTGEGPTAP